MPLEHAFKFIMKYIPPKARLGNGQEDEHQIKGHEFPQRFGDFVPNTFRGPVGHFEAHDDA
eukprot:scaffold5520_cov167-Amphora_coffeaeformis.AAC.10